MKKTQKAKKEHKFVVTLSDRDYKKLLLIAKNQKVTRPLAARKMLHAQIASLSVPKTGEQAKNQLGLFDFVQTEIF